MTEESNEKGITTSDAVNMLAGSRPAVHFILIVTKPGTEEAVAQNVNQLPVDQGVIWAAVVSSSASVLLAAVNPDPNIANSVHKINLSAAIGAIPGVISQTYYQVLDSEYYSKYVYPTNRQTGPVGWRPVNGWP